MDGLGWEDLDGVCETVLAWPLDAVGAWVLEAAEDPLAERRIMVRWDLVLCILAGRIYWGGSGEIAGIRAYPQLPGSAPPPPQSVAVPQAQLVGRSYWPVGLSMPVIGRLFEAEERREVLRPTFDHLAVSVARPELFADPLRAEVEGAASTLGRPLLAITSPGEERWVAHAGWTPGPALPQKRRNGFPALQLWSNVALR